MIAFLRLFPAFRDLETLVQTQAHSLQDLDIELASCRASHADLLTEKFLLQDRLDAAVADKEKLWQMVRESLDGERYALHTMVNHAVQKSGAGIPFQDAHSLPPNTVAKPQEPGPVGRRGRLLPSEMLARRNQAFIDEFVLATKPVE